MVVLRQQPVDVRWLQSSHVGDVKVHQIRWDVVISRIQHLRHGRISDSQAGATRAHESQIDLTAHWCSNFHALAETSFNVAHRAWFLEEKFLSTQARR